MIVSIICYILTTFCGVFIAFLRSNDWDILFLSRGQIIISVINFILYVLLNEWSWRFGTIIRLNLTALILISIVQTLYAAVLIATTCDIVAIINIILAILSLVVTIVNLYDRARKADPDMPFALSLSWFIKYTIRIFIICFIFMLIIMKIYS